MPVSTETHLHLFAGIEVADKLWAFFQHHEVKVLNVAGPRASKEPGVGEFVARILEEALGEMARSESPPLEELRTTRPRLSRDWDIGVLEDMDC